MPRRPQRRGREPVGWVRTAGPSSRAGAVQPAGCGLESDLLGNPAAAEGAPEEPAEHPGRGGNPSNGDPDSSGDAATVQPTVRLDPGRGGAFVGRVPRAGRFGPQGDLDGEGAGRIKDV